MADLPKLKIIKPYWDVPEEIRSFEQGRFLPFSSHICVLVEGNPIFSYEELVRLARQDRYKDREFLEIRFFEIVTGG